MPSPDQFSPPGEPFFTRFQDAQTEARIRAAEEKVAAERGLWALADLYVPTDVREAAARWKLENTLVEMWRAAFIQGWRASLRADRPVTDPTDGGADAG